MIKNHFKQYRADIEIYRPSSFLDYKKYLGSIYQKLKELIPNYSYRKFSEHLGFKESTLLHHIIKGYRPLSLVNGQKIMTSLNITGKEKKYFLLLVQYQAAKDSLKREKLFAKLVEVKNEIVNQLNDKVWLEYFSSWHHAAIREFILAYPEIIDIETIANSLVPSLRPEQVIHSIKLLEKMHLITNNGTHWQSDQKPLSTGDEVRGIGVVRYHQQMIEHGKEALTRLPANERDISGITFSADEQTFQQIKGLIHEFNAQILNLINEKEHGASVKSKGVYQINTQLFSLAHNIGKKR